MTYRNLPRMQMATLREKGLTWAAIGKRFGVSGPTVRHRVGGLVPSRLIKLRVPHGAEHALADLMGRTDRRFNDRLTAADARTLRELTEITRILDQGGTE